MKTCEECGWPEDFCFCKFKILAVELMAPVVKEINHAIKESEKNIMSALSDVAGELNAAIAKLQAIDAKVKALSAAVAASSNPTLDAATQAALDGLVAEVGTVATDAGA